MKKPEKFWDFLAANFDKTESRFEVLKSKTTEITKKYLKQNDIVLDYGCATGKKTIAFSGSVKEIYAIDFSSKMIEIAKKNIADTSITNIHFSQKTIIDEELKTGSFDVILAFNILHLVKDKENVIKRIYELLKPGGLFISTTPCLNENIDPKNNFILKIFLWLLKLKLIPQHLTNFNFSDLEELICSSKFSIIEAQKFFDGISTYYIVSKKIEAS